MVRSWSPGGHRQRFAAEYVLPEGLAEAWRQRHPEVSDTGPALRALRQWLRIHPLAPGEVGNPSVAVDELWERLVRDGDTWAAFQEGAYRRADRTEDDPQIARRQALRVGDQGLALAYAMACRDEDLPRYGMRLTLLFEADEATGISGGARWVLNCDHEVCRPPDGHRCIHHDLLPLIPDDLPDQLPWRYHQAYPEVSMKNDSQFDRYGP